MVNIFVCGDIVNYTHKDGTFCSRKIVDFIKGADYSLCNLEAPVSGIGQPQPKSGPHHSQCKETIRGLKEQGFDHLLLANNHIMDYGVEGLRATINEIKKQGLDYSGAGITHQEAYKPFIATIGDLKVGMINAAEAAQLFGVMDYFRSDGPGHGWINHSLIDKTIVRLKSLCDCIIVFSHAGLEHYSIPQKEWRYRYRHFCDLGADVVIGSHPHTPQGYEEYGKSLIFYSLGNFYFDSDTYKDKEDCSFALFLELERDRPPRFKPLYYYKAGGVVRLAPPEKQVDLQGLCSLLNDNYEKLHDAMSLETYKKIKRNLYLTSLLTSSLRRIYSVLLGRNKKIDKAVLQLHLIKNESYYYAAKHALEVLARKEHAK